jgi:hypothetical protein
MTIADRLSIVVLFAVLKYLRCAYQIADELQNVRRICC